MAGMGNSAIIRAAHWLALLAAGCAALGTGGCNSSLGRSETAGPSASPRQHPTLEGIPLPNGFRLVDDRSVGVSSGRLRVAKFEFIGDTDRSTLSRFYKEYMPSGGWTLRKEDFDRGIYDLRFESSTEECTVRLRPEKNRTAIVIHVIPLPRGTAEREVSPPVRRTQ